MSIAFACASAAEQPHRRRFRHLAIEPEAQESLERQTVLDLELGCLAKLCERLSMPHCTLMDDNRNSELELAQGLAQIARSASR